MSTNFYFVEKPDCECCKRPYVERHIGQSAGGWRFLFADKARDRCNQDDLDAPAVVSWAHLRGFLATVHEIRNEYGDVYTLEAFVEYVDACQGRRYRGDLADPEGYCFGVGPFS